MSLLEELDDHPLCGDGAVGTLLMERGIAPQECLEALCLSRPELVSQIHSEYVAAGARIIETNSFGANAVRLARHGLANRVNELNWQAAQLARQAAGRTAYVAGSVGPLGISQAEAERSGIDHEECFRTQIGALLEGGVNLIFLETFQDLDELVLALHVKQSLHHCPAICSLAPDQEGRLPSGLSLGEAFARLIDHDAEIAGINCVNGPAALRLFENLSLPDLPLAVYPNAGLPRHEGGRLVYDLSPAAFAQAGVSLVERGARIVGGCCGTTPAHIAALSQRLAGL